MRLIDADKLLGLFIESGQKHGREHGCKLGENWLLDYNDIKAVIDNAPTIEPKRKFIQIITTYYPDELISYDEYKGKPYFSIEYQENGEVFVGYGTYNPDVLSRYLRDYFFNER